MGTEDVRNRAGQEQLTSPYISPVARYLQQAFALAALTLTR